MSTEQRIVSRACADRLGVSLDRKASLWAFFFIASLASVRQGGRLALVLPQAALHAGYSRSLMHAAGAQFSSSMMISLRETCFASEGTNERVILFLGDGCLRSDGPILGVTSATGPILLECPLVRDVETFLGSNPRARESVLPKLNGHAVPHLLAASQSQVVHLEALPQTTCLGDHADVKIGAVTGANDYFVLTEKNRRDRRIPMSAVLPIVARWPKQVGFRFSLPHWKAMRDSGERCWLLYPQEHECRKTVLAYLNSMPSSEIATNRTFQKRPFWYRTQLTTAPDAFVRYMGARGPQFVAVTMECQVTNSLHAIYFKRHVTSVQRRALLLSCHSSISLLSAEFEGRSYGTDALKMEPSEMRKLRLVLPARLNESATKGLAVRVHGLLLDHHFDKATQVVDDWLYASVPELEKALPRARASETLRLARARRH